MYFYGFNKLEKTDILNACSILATTMTDKYDCGFDVSNLKALRRKLYRKNKKTNKIDYFLSILIGRI